MTENAAAPEETQPEPEVPAQMVEVDGKMLPVEVGADGRKQATDENGNTYILADKKPSAIELKRQKIWMERYKRLVNKGIDPKKIPLMLAEEDYKNMPLAEKFEQYKKLDMAANRRLAQDINGLQHNDGVLADSMDINFRAFAKMLVEAGISLERQSAILKETEVEIQEDRKKQAEQRKRATEMRQKAAQEAREQKLKEELVKAEGKPALTEAPPPEESAPPDGATVFGG